MADIKVLADQLANLTVKDVNELAAILEKDYNIKPAVCAPQVSAAAVTNTNAPQTAEGSGMFDVILKNAGTSKLAVIKLVKEVTGLGLKEAKDLVDAGGKAVKENLAKAEADDLKKKLEEVGAEVELKNR